jgi:hypothetical protein
MAGRHPVLVVVRPCYLQLVDIQLFQGIHAKVALFVVNKMITCRALRSGRNPDPFRRRPSSLEQARPGMIGNFQRRPGPRGGKLSRY